MKLEEVIGYLSEELEVSVSQIKQSFAKKEILKIYKNSNLEIRGLDVADYEGVCFRKLPKKMYCLRSVNTGKDRYWIFNYSVKWNGIEKNHVTIMSKEQLERNELDNMSYWNLKEEEDYW